MNLICVHTISGGHWVSLHIIPNNHIWYFGLLTDWIPMGSLQVFMVHLYYVLHVPHFYILWYDGCIDHSEQSSLRRCCICILCRLQSLLRFLDAESGKVHISNTTYLFPIKEIFELALSYESPILEKLEETQGNHITNSWWTIHILECSMYSSRAWHR